MHRLKHSSHRYLTYVSKALRVEIRAFSFYGGGLFFVDDWERVHLGDAGVYGLGREGMEIAGG